jgi:hypothetical protein
VKKLYVRHRGSATPTLRINTGRYEHLYGRSLFEIAMEARSQHKSQEQGVLELKGPQFSSLNLAEKDIQDSAIFDHVDTSIAGFAKNASDDGPAVRQALESIQGIAAEAYNYHHERTPQRVIDLVVKGYVTAAAGESSAANPATRSFLAGKKRQFAEAIKIVAGIQLDALSDRETVVPGENLLATVRLFLSNPKMVTPKEIVLRVPEQWSVSGATEPPAPPQGFFRRETGDHAAYFEIGVPGNAPFTQPYWLGTPRNGDLFAWDTSNPNITYPFGPPVVTAEIAVEIGGERIVFTQPLEFRFADDTRGEVRRDVNVVPRLRVSLDQETIVVPYSDLPQTRRVVMTVTNNGRNALNGTVGLRAAGTGLVSSVPSPVLDLKREGERASFSFEVGVPAKTKPGTYRLTGNATIDELSSSSDMNVISYPHIQTHRTYRTALATVSVVDLKTVPVRVGYITGSGDRVDDAIRQMGFEVEEIDESMLGGADLSRYDTIVVGIRAYQVRPDLVANNKRLLDFAKNGGTLIVQYQLPQSYSQQNLPPFPAQTGPRVADENAPVMILQPTHPIFNFPNRISQEDFKGWVQERNLYNFSTMDPSYVGLLESHDAGDAENNGGLVIADIGKGKYIYCSYSLFRQLPAGVTGAYRLLANLISSGGRGSSKRAG